MLVYCKDGVVIASHDDSQNVPASAYGAGVVIVRSDDIVMPGDPAPALTATLLKEAAAAKRRAVVGGGCTVIVDGIPIAVWADTETWAALNALVSAATLNPALTTLWKARTGAFFELNAADIATLATGVMAFIQASFALESEVAADIDAENITTIEGIDAAGWPANG